MNEEKNELSAVHQIAQHAINNEPSKLKTAMHKEIASRVMHSIESKRSEIGPSMFNTNN